MNLNSYILLDYLPKPRYYRIKSPHHSFHLTSICIYSPVLPMKAGFIYLAKAEDIETGICIEDTCLLVCAGIPASIPDSFQGDIICCEETYSETEFFGRICRAFQEVSAWEQDLLDCLIKRRGLNQLCRKSLSIFKNSIIIHSSGYSVLAEAESESYPFPGRYTQKDTGYLTEEVVSELELSPGFHETFHAKNPEFFYRDGVLCIYSNIFIHGEFVCRITVEGDVRHITEGKRSLLYFLTDIVREYLIATSYSSYSNLHSFKEHLIHFVTEGGIEDKKYLFAMLSKIKWEKEDIYFCAVLEPDKVVHGSNDMHYDCLMLEKKFFGALVVPAGEVLLMVCNTRVSGYSKEELRSLLGEVIRERLMKAGYSGLFGDFFEIPSYYQQALAALETGKKYDFMLWQYDFENYALQYILDYGIKSLPPQTMIPIGLHKIIEHDKKYSSNYCETLRAFMENDLSAAKTSKELYIHISTFRYRMEKILGLLQMDIKNPDEKLYLTLIFKLLDSLGESS